MTSSHRVFLSVIALLFVVSGCDRIQSAFVQRAASRALKGDRNDLLDDGALHVVLCGTGSPIADAERASACTAVLAGGHFFQVDTGPGSARQVALERLPRTHLDAILLTHFHSDHIGDLGEAVTQSWIAGRQAPLIVYGPPGVEQVVEGFRQAYSFDNGYRVTHHGKEFMPPSAGTAVAQTVTLPGPGQAAVVFDADGLRVTAFAVDHQPIEPAYGYRFDFRGRSVVVSGDTKKSDNLIRHAQDTDVLVHEALAAHMVAQVMQYAQREGLTRWAKLTSDVVNYHTTPVEAVEVAKAAHARVLVLTHIVPGLPNYVARRMFLAGTAGIWDGEIVVGKDGMEFTLPPGTTTVTID